MINPFASMLMTNDLMRLGIHYNQMNVAAAEVIMRRVTKMAQGAMSAPEAMGMVMEKATTFTKAGERAAVAASRGANPVTIAAAALTPIRARTRSNVRKYRR
jgi:hypothetical protein